jgi:hypothetical protein
LEQVFNRKFYLSSMDEAEKSHMIELYELYIDNKKSA